MSDDTGPVPLTHVVTGRFRWRCLLCSVSGVGDVTAYNQHYGDWHYNKEERR